MKIACAMIYNRSENANFSLFSFKQKTPILAVGASALSNDSRTMEMEKYQPLYLIHNLRISTPEQNRTKCKNTAWPMPKPVKQSKNCCEIHT